MEETSRTDFESTGLTPKDSVADLSATVKQAIEKIEKTQLARARQEVAERLRDILDKVNFALSHARLDHQQVPRITFTTERKEREWLIDAITEFATGSSTKEEILKFILQWLSDSNQILINDVDLEEDEEVEKRSTEWIDEVNVKVQTGLASSQACIDNLYKLSNTLFGHQHHLKPKPAGHGGKDANMKWWREKKLDPKTLMHLLDMQPMSTVNMVEPNTVEQLDAAVGEIDMMLTDIAKYPTGKKAQTIAFRYIRKFVENLHKAFHVRSQEYFEVEHELRKSDSFGSQGAEGNLAKELNHLREHSKALQTRAELAERHSREACSMNYNLESTIKLLRSKVEQLQNVSKPLAREKVTSEEFSPSADLQVKTKQAPEINKSMALVKESKDKIIPPESLWGKCPLSEEHKHILGDGRDKPEEQRAVLVESKGQNIPFEEPEEQRTILEVFKEENIPFGETEGGNIPTEVSNGGITPTPHKLEAVLTEAVKDTMLISDLNARKKHRTSARKEGALKTKAKQMAVDMLTDFQTAVLYSLDHGLSSGQELSPDDVCKVQALLKSAELKNLYGVIEKMIKEIFAKPKQNFKQEFSEQSIQVLNRSKESLVEKPEEKQPEFMTFAELLKEISQFSIIQEIALDELSAQIQYFIEEAKQDKSLTQQETHFHEKTLDALDTILMLEKKSFRAGMDQLIRIQEATNHLCSINNAFDLKGKEMKLQAEHCKKEGVPLTNTTTETMEITIRPRRMVFQAAGGEEIVDRSYIANVTYLRRNYKTLDQAVYNGVISKQLHAIATHLINQTLTTVQLRLAYLFKKYIAFRHIQTLRHYLNGRMSDISNKDEKVARDLCTFANRLEIRVKSSMQHWGVRQQMVNQSRQRHLNRMTDLFNQLKHRAGLHLISPLLATKPRKSRTQMQFRSPLQPTYLVTSRTPCYLCGEGNCTPSAFLGKRNSHMWSTNIVDGSLPIAKKDPAIPASLPGTPKLVAIDRNNYFRQMLAKTQIHIVGDRLQIPTKSLPIPPVSPVPRFSDKKVALAVAASSNKFQQS
uniref:protein FAM186B-like n=1 Tax=Pristiophorus japonicus TaxID=55135 RepID=UPI00398E8F18